MNTILKVFFFITIASNVFAQNNLRNYKINLKITDQQHNPISNCKVLIIVRGAPMPTSIFSDSLGFISSNQFVMKMENQNFELDSIYFGEIQVTKYDFQDTSISLCYYKKTYNENDTLTLVLNKPKPLKLLTEYFNYTFFLGTFKDLVRKDSLILFSYQQYGKYSVDNYLDLVNLKENNFRISHYRKLTFRHEIKSEEKIKLKVKKNEIVVCKFNGQKYVYRGEIVGSIGEGYQVKLIKTNKSKGKSSIFEIDTIINYSVGLSSNNDSYNMNGKEITKENYEHFRGNTFEEAQNCCPCIFVSKDINEKVLYDYFGCAECQMGFYHTYFPNGKLKVSGLYKEIDSNKLESSNFSSLCSIKNGKWIYYDSLGHEMYTKYWENNVCIRSEPNNKTTVLEITCNQFDSIPWSSEVLLETFLSAEIEPTYNNDLKNNKERTIISISSFNNESVNYEIEGYDLNNFKTFLDQFYLEKRLHVYVSVSFMSDEELIKGYSFKFK